MEQKNPAPKCWWGGRKKQPPPFGSFFLLQWNCPAVGIVVVSVARRLLVRFVLMGWHTHSADAENQPTNPVRTHTHLQQGRCCVYWEKLLRLLLWYLFFHREFVCVCVRMWIYIYLDQACVCVCVCLEGRRRLGCNHKLSATVKDHLGRRLIDLLLLLFSSWKTVCVYVYVSRFWHWLTLSQIQ
jgi:hypothetical protein